MRFSDLAGFESIESARDFIIEKEVEAILRASHSEQFDWMESKFAVPLRKGLEVWPEFIEITERRNLFVHTGGVVSAQYLGVCAQNRSSVDGAGRGSKLGVSQEYFDRSYEVLFEIGVKLAQVLWRKLLPSTLDRADQNLIDITFRLISEERYRLAIVLLDFAVDLLPRHSSEDIRLRFVFNRAQAYKWSGHDEKARAQINKEDLSAAKPIFKLAASAIRDDIGGAAEHIREIGPKGEIGLLALRNWPIFKKLREKEEFAAVVLEVFGEPLATKQLDTEIPVLINPEADQQRPTDEPEQSGEDLGNAPQPSDPAN